MEAEWIFYVGVGLLAIIGVMETAKRVLERIAAKRGPDNTKADEIAQYLGMGTTGLRALAVALGLEVWDDEPAEATAAKIKTKVDASKVK